MPTVTVRRKPHLKTLRSAVLPAGRVRLLHVFFPELAQMQAGDHARAVWALRSFNDRTGKYDRVRLFYRVEFLGPSWSHVSPEDPLPGTGGRGIAVMASRGAVRVFWNGDEPRTSVLSD
jgi:hypothetical protein